MCPRSPMMQRTRQEGTNGRPRSQSRSRSQSRRRAKDKPKISTSQLVIYKTNQAQEHNNALALSKPIKRQHKQIASEPKRSPEGVVNIREGDVRAAYKVLPIVIGTGSFGTVRACIHRESRTKLAIKSISIKGHDGNAKLLKNEITLLSRANHRNIIKLVDVMQDREYIHIIMEQCKGGDLFDLTVDDKTRLSEVRIHKIVGSLLDAIAHLHEKNIVHRDLKAEHLMFSSNDINSVIKIIDFGVATLHKPGDAPLTAFAGSLRSVAPEVVKRSYGRECDLWSVGIITYFLLTQNMPFNGPTNDIIFQKIVSGKFFYPKWAEAGLSEESKHFIDCLIVVDPRTRLTAKQALTHPWIRNKKIRHVRPVSSQSVAPPRSRPQIRSKLRSRSQSRSRSHRG